MSKEKDNNFDEEAVLQLLRSGNAQAMEVMYDHFAPMLYGLVLRIVKEDAAAEEVLKETFLYVWQHHTAFVESKQNLSLRMIHIAKTIAHKKIPFNKFLENRKPSNLVGTDGVVALLKNNSLPGFSGDKTSGMSCDQSTVLELVFFGGGKVNEVAKHLGINETRVLQLLREAVNHYRKETQEIQWS